MFGWSFATPILECLIPWIQLIYPILPRWSATRLKLQCDSYFGPIPHHEDLDDLLGRQGFHLSIDRFPVWKRWRLITSTSRTMNDTIIYQIYMRIMHLNASDNSSLANCHTTCTMELFLSAFNRGLRFVSHFRSTCQCSIPNQSEVSPIFTNGLNIGHQPCLERRVQNVQPSSAK